MNNIKVYKYILLILMILILISGGFALTKPDLLKQIKVVIFWYLLILELNLLNIYSVLSFYERNKNRKGPRGVKGIVGSRGLKGKSILCQSCNTAGSSSSNNKFAKTNGIMNDNVKAGRCIFPFLDKYIYRYDVAPITSTLPENMNLNIPTSVYPNGWCATSVNNQFEPVTIGFYDESLATQLANEAELDRMRSMYYQSNYGILDIQVVMGNTLREAKNVFSRKYEKQGYTFYDNDVNEGTGGKFIYFCVKKGVASKGVVDMKIKYNPGQLTTPDNRLNQQGNSVSGSLDYEATSQKLQRVVKTKKTELLFLALFLQLLKPGGRAAVIVPDGVCFGSSKAHKELRRSLVEDHLLEGVISLPSGVFKPYAGVSTAILLFTKTGKGGTENVWFYDLQADGWSLDDKREPLLSIEKLGPNPNNNLGEEEHKKNNLPDCLKRWSQRRGSELERLKTEQSFCVSKKDIKEQGYDLSLNRHKEIVFEEVEHRPPLEIIDELRSLESEISKAMDELEEMLR